MSTHGEPHDDDLDRLIDRTAQAMTSGAPPAGLVFTVRARVNARPPAWKRAPVWGIATSAVAAAGLLVAVVLRQPAPAPDADAPARMAVSPGASARRAPAPAAAASTTRMPPAVAGGAPRTGATPPAYAAPVLHSNAAAANGSVVSGAPSAAGTLISVEPEPLVFEPLEERQLMVDALRDPVPLEVEQLTIEPITLTEGDV